MLDHSELGVQNSIETIHDEIHIDIGGPDGHMGKNEYAGVSVLSMHWSIL
jgi:hypothetical protein